MYYLKFQVLFPIINLLKQEISDKKYKQDIRFLLYIEGGIE